jgi:hypothetical protein
MMFEETINDFLTDIDTTSFNEIQLPINSTTSEVCRIVKDFDCKLLCQ